ncbi:MAG: GxxExxY protein [Alphaproteobacteria bacterium]|nr:GxxExxY protein [Alphaproteobacteria bacterium]
MSQVIDLAKPENKISGLIVDRAIYVHKHLGPGLLESAYEEALVYFLQKAGLHVERQKAVPIQIEDLSIESGFRPDLIVNDSVICELKSIEKLKPIHDAQLMTYLRLSGIGVGLLINFNVPLLKEGLRRIVV